MELAIRDITELRKEIENLKVIESHQIFEIKNRFSSPSAIFATAGSLFASDKANGVKHNNLFNKDLIAILSRIILPFTLNKTIFRKSNFITKFLVNIASQRASTLINQKSVTSIWDKIKVLLPKKQPAEKKKQVVPLLVSHENAVIDADEEIFNSNSH